MPNINFKSEFAGKVASGEKTMTIRRTFKRGKSFYVHLFTGLRTKKCKKIGVVFLKKHTPTPIYIDDVLGDTEICLGGVYLSDSEQRTLATKDGFRCLDDFLEFFKTQYGLPFAHVFDKRGAPFRSKFL